MNAQNDGGPAFPKLDYFAGPDGSGGVPVSEGGMSLRDYFAAAAMQGLIASNDDGAGDRIAEIPDYAYEIADAMLKAREAKS